MEQKKNQYIFILLTVLCIMMIVLSSVKDGFMNPLRNAVGTVLVPIQSGVNYVGYTLYSRWEKHKTLLEAEAENEKLNAKIDLLTEENNILKQNEEELKRIIQIEQEDAKKLPRTRKTGSRSSV